LILSPTFSIDKKPNVGPSQKSCQNNGPFLIACARPMSLSYDFNICVVFCILKELAIQANTYLVFPYIFRCQTASIYLKVEAQ